MTYADIFNKVKNTIKDKNPASVCDMAVQVEITGEGEGIFYIKTENGKILVEPYDYRDNDASIKVSSADLMRICDNEIDFMTAFTLGRLEISGNGKKAAQLKNLFRKK